MLIVVQRATIAIILSTLMVGIGQAYLGQFYRGAAIFAIGLGLALTSYFLLGSLGIVISASYWLWNILDVDKLGRSESQSGHITKGRKCPNCNGSGTVRTHSTMASTYAPSLSFTRCSMCGGSGSVPDI